MTLVLFVVVCQCPYVQITNAVVPLLFTPEVESIVGLGATPQLPSGAPRET
jgi:hypothetical protein